MADRSELERLRQVVVKTTMPVYVARDGGTRRAYNTLTEEYELQLTEHLALCDIALQQCPDCWLLYVSIGQEEYVKRLTEDMSDD